MSDKKFGDYINYVKNKKQILEDLIDIYDKENGFAYTKKDLIEKLEQCNRILKRWE